MVDDDDQEHTGICNLAEVLAGAKTKSQRPWLVVVSGSSIGKTYELKHQLVLGRSAQCDVMIDGEGVSRRHAMVERTAEGRVQIVDLESRNGTYVNGERVSREMLSDGDRIQLGESVTLKLSYQDELDEALQRNLYESATRDPLTRAVNKRGFHEAFEMEYAFAHRHGTPLSLLALDVDHFKRVNDTHGHVAGDHVLRTLADSIRGSIRREDVFARVGGEEFVTLLRGIALQGAIECAERIRASVERLVVETGGVRIPVTVSLGVATLQGHPSSTALLEAADRALYGAKRSGRNRVEAAKGG